MMSPEQLKKRQKQMEVWSNSLSLDEAAGIATASSDTDIGAALGKSKTEFASIKDKLGDNMDNLIKNAGKRIGFDFKGAYQAKLPEVRDQMGLPSNDANYDLNKKAAVRDARTEAERQQNSVVQKPSDLINSYLSSPANTRSATEVQENIKRIEDAAARRDELYGSALGAAASSMEGFNAHLKKLNKLYVDQQTRDRQF